MVKELLSGNMLRIVYNKDRDKIKCKPLTPKRNENTNNKTYGGNK